MTPPTPNPIDVLSLAEGNVALGFAADAETQADTIASWITGVSERIDDLCGPVVARQVTELHNGGCASIRPKQTPVFDVCSLKEYSYLVPTTLAEESLSAQPPAGFMIDRDEDDSFVVHLVRRASGNDSVFASGRRNVELTYCPGRFAATDDITSKWKTAAESILRRLWAREAPAWAKGGAALDDSADGPGFFRAVDPMIAEFLGSELRMVLR